MAYDLRNRMEPSYGTQSPMYGRPATTAPPPPPPSHHHPMYGQAPGQSSSLYPRVGQHSGGNFPGRFNSTSPPSSTSGIGIRVALKPEYRITPPPPLAPQGDVPRCTFQFDFDLEKKILAEADQKESQIWSRLENLPSRGSDQASMASAGDPVMNKYIAFGLNRDAVPLAVANYGDNPNKVKEFADGYTHLKEMGFSSNSAADALLMNENDTNKAIQHLLNNPSY